MVQLSVISYQLSAIAGRSRFAVSQVRKSGPGAPIHCGRSGAGLLRFAVSQVRKYGPGAPIHCGKSGAGLLRSVLSPGPRIRTWGTHLLWGWGDWAIEIRGIPGPRIRTWGTHSLW